MEDLMREYFANKDEIKHLIAFKISTTQAINYI